MKNPIYHEYRRSSLFGLLLVIALAALGALVHYLRSVDDKVLQTQARLNTVSHQLDSEFTPVLAYMQAVRQAAISKLALPVTAVEDSLLLLQIADATTQTRAITAEDGSVNNELLMLQRLQPYFELARDTQPHLVGMYYFSAQGFAYNGLPKWSDYIVDQILLWEQQQAQDPGFERDQVFYAEFLTNQAAVMLPLYFEDKKLGSFVFAISLEPMLAPMYKQYKNTEFMLLDQTGKIISSSTAKRVQSINEHLLQVQRLNSMPWSLALMEQKTSLFAAGLKEFVWHWFSYAMLLGLMLLAMQYRYRRRTLSPMNRLLIHIKRLHSGQSHGVRHVPPGWDEVFDKTFELTQKSHSE